MIPYLKCLEWSNLYTLQPSLRLVMTSSTLKIRNLRCSLGSVEGVPLGRHEDDGVPKITCMLLGLTQFILKSWGLLSAVILEPEKMLSCWAAEGKSIEYIFWTEPSSLLFFFLLDQKLSSDGIQQNETMAFAKGIFLYTGLSDGL